MDRIKIAERCGDMVTAGHRVLNEEQESRLPASQVCSGRAGLGESMDSQLSMQNKISSQETQKVFENSDVQKKSLIRTILWNL